MGGLSADDEGGHFGDWQWQCHGHRVSMTTAEWCGWCDVVEWAVIPFVRSCWGCCRAATDAAWHTTATTYGRRAPETAPSVRRQTTVPSRTRPLPTSTSKQATSINYWLSAGRGLAVMRWSRFEDLGLLEFDSSGRARGHSLKSLKKRCRLDLCTFFLRELLMYGTVLMISQWTVSLIIEFF